MVSVGKKVWLAVSWCGQICKMWSGVRPGLRTTFAVGWVNNTHSLWMFLSPQWPVRRRKMVVWLLLTSMLIWSCCGLIVAIIIIYLFFVFHSICLLLLKYSVLVSVWEFELLQWGPAPSMIHCAWHISLYVLKGLSKAKVNKLTGKIENRQAKFLEGCNADFSDEIVN